MYYSTANGLLMAALAASTMAHMNMANPPPLMYKGNPNAGSNVDYSITSPTTNETFPCKGALSVFDTDQGKPVATWAPGSQQTVTLEGGASHNGGSCQLSLSYDKGTTWTVIYSKVGNCPTDTKLAFTVPSDAPTGDKVLLGWSWINHTGNREFYMNCASITISGSTTKREVGQGRVADRKNRIKRATTAFAQRPPMFVANLGFTSAGKPCVKESIDILYPEPGPDLDNVSTTTGNVTDCGTGGPFTGDWTASNAKLGGVVGMPLPTASVETATTTAPTVVASSATSPGGIFLTNTGSAATTATVPAHQTVSSKPSSAVPTSATGASKTASSPASTGSSSPGASGGMSGSCTDEGAWFCAADGASFQRCASGAWSATMPMAAGTKCTPGLADTLSYARKHRRSMSRVLPVAWA